MQQSILQGTLPIGTHTLYTVPVGKESRVNLRFFGPLAYGIQLSRYDSILGTSVILYDLTLSAGDSVVDSSYYLLKENDELVLTVATNSVDYNLFFVETP